jgi:hypothetical protein
LPVPKASWETLKNSKNALNVRRTLRDQSNVGAVIPPHRGYIRRERPSTPSAHMA